jgi:hypothetical protein
MAKPKPIILQRRDAAQAAVQRFKDRPHRWSSNDCARMVAFTLRKLGHKPPMPRAGSYRSALTARKALHAAGFKSLEDALDGMGLPRIGWASAVVADIVAMEGEDGWLALGVAVGNGRVLAYHVDAPGAVIVQPTNVLIAWRSV